MKQIFIIGAGEVGRRLGGALARSGCSVQFIRRQDSWEQIESRVDVPCMLAMREEDLAAAVARFEPEQFKRLILVQNGFLEAVHGELAGITRGLIWFMSKGDFFRELCPSLFSGPLASGLAEAMSAGGIESKAIAPGDDFIEEMILKGYWNTIVGLPLVVHQVDLATYKQNFKAELLALAEEAANVAQAEYGVKVSPERAVQMLHETTAELGFVKGGQKALAWRNGAIQKFGLQHGVPTPVSDQLLKAVKGS